MSQPRDTTGFGRPDLRLPAVIDTVGRRCITLQLPDDNDHVQLLAGILHPLTQSYNWSGGTIAQRDQIAEVYQDMYDAIEWLGVCPLPAITNIRVASCGIEVQYDDDPTWLPVTDSGFVPLTGICTMTGGLEIYPTVDESALTVKSLTDPYNNNKIIRVLNYAGTEVAWINPRGDATFSGQSDGLRALVLQGGGILIDHNKYLYWKDSLGNIRIAFGVGSNQMFFRSGTAGLRMDDSGGNSQFILDSANVLRFQNTAGAVSTQIRIKSGASQAAVALLQFERNNGDSTVTFNDAGQQISRIRNQANNIVSDGLQLDARPTTGGIDGLGVALRLSASTAVGSARNQALLYTVWENATDASRQAKVILSAFDYSGEKKIIEGGVTGASTPKVGFLGATPQPSLGLSGSCLGNAVLKSVCELLALFGLAIDATTLGTPYDLTAVDVTGDKFGNEALASLITGLDTAGYINDLTSDTGAYVYTLPDPLAVDGSWNGVEAGKLMAIALEANGYMIDQTDLGDTPIPSQVFLNLRCRACAAANVIVHHWYNYLVLEMAYPSVGISAADRWEKARDVAVFNMDLQQDIYSEWAVKVFTAFMNGIDTVDLEAHQADMINYIPDIQQAFYCGIGDDGILTASGLIDIQTILFSDNHTLGVPDDINTWFYDFFQYLDAGELSLAIAQALNSTYVADVDCEAMTNCDADEPDWCKKYNFAISAYAPPFVLTDGSHVFGGTLSGYKTDPDGDLRIDFPFPTIAVTIRYTVTIPTAAISVVVGADAGGGFTSSLSTAPGTYIETITIPEANRADGWYFEAHCNEEVCTVTLKEVYDMTGTGIEPTEGNNCD